MQMFKFDQLAIATPDLVSHEEAKCFLTETVGAEFSAEDIVTAIGRDFQGQRINNQAHLSFAYNVFEAKIEYEVLTYVAGWNWHQLKINQFPIPPFTSHFGFHTQDKTLIADLCRRYATLQEVVTVEHTNPAAKDRRYHYIILNTRKLLGTELKIIQRLTLKEAAQWLETLS